MQNNQVVVVGRRLVVYRRGADPPMREKERQGKVGRAEQSRQAKATTPPPGPSRGRGKKEGLEKSPEARKTRAKS